jgi:carboxypeptidase Q
MDDGGGFVTAWEAVRAIKALGIKPKRTIRAVVYVNEENGDKGGDQYAKDLADVTYQGIANHSWAMETDIGPFAPYGIGVSCATGSDCGAAQAQLALIGAELLSGIGSGNVSAGGGGTDVGPTCALGVVCSGLNVLDPRLTSDTNNPCTADAMGVWGPPSYDASNPQLYDSQYFWVHHSEADTMERVDPRQLNHGAAALAVWAYAISQLPTLLPRDAPAPPAPAPAAAASDSGVTAIAGGAAGGLAVVALLGYFAATRGGALVKSVCGGGGGRKDEYAPV